MNAADPEEVIQVDESDGDESSVDGHTVTTRHAKRTTAGNSAGREMRMTAAATDMARNTKQN